MLCVLEGSYEYVFIWVYMFVWVHCKYTCAFSVYVCLCRGQRSNFDVLFCCCLFVLLYFGFKSSVIGLLKIFYCCVETLTMATLIKKTFN